MYPADLKYTKDHEWLKELGDGTASVGITHYAQDALGDVVFVKLPEVGEKLATGADFGEVESVKTVSELFSPCDGEVVAVNGDLEAHPDLTSRLTTLVADFTGLELPAADLVYCGWSLPHCPAPRFERL